MSQTDRKRPWLAAVLAIASPGLGHLYLREWIRAVLWFALILSTLWVLIPQSALALETASVEALLAVPGQVSPRSRFAVGAIVVLSGVDAYWMAAQGNRRAAAEDGARCPACGKELDEDLSFCHWCTTELPDGDERV